jgi:hypothetical protein
VFHGILPASCRTLLFALLLGALIALLLDVPMAWWGRASEATPVRDIQAVQPYDPLR